MKNRRPKAHANRVNMPYSSSLDVFYQAELNMIIEWCQMTLDNTTWYINPAAYPSRVYFLHERDLTMYLLKWGK